MEQGAALTQPTIRGPPIQKISVLPQGHAAARPAGLRHRRPHRASGRVRRAMVSSAKPVCQPGGCRMRRREFILALGGAAAGWPLAARSQQTMPLVGYVRIGFRAASAHLETAFRQGLRSVGFEEGRNVAIDYRYAENHSEQLPVLVAELIRRQVVLIYAGDNPTAMAAKATGAATPIVFR